MHTSNDPKRDMPNAPLNKRTGTYVAGVDEILGTSQEHVLGALEVKTMCGNIICAFESGDQLRDLLASNLDRGYVHGIRTRELVNTSSDQVRKRFSRGRRDRHASS